MQANKSVANRSLGSFDWTIALLIGVAIVSVVALVYFLVLSLKISPNVFLIAGVVMAVAMLILLPFLLLRSRTAARELMAELDAVSAQSRVTAHAMQELILNAVPSPMVMVDSEGRVVFANTQFCVLFGYGLDELAGKPIEMLLPQKFRHDHQVLRSQYQENATERAMGSGRELFGLRSDGTEAPLEIGLKPLTLDNSHYVLASVIDISERRREAERLRLVIEAAPNAMLMVSGAGLITLVNMQFEQLFGYSRDEILGEPIEMLIPMRFRHAHVSFRKRFVAQPGARPMGAGQELFGLRRDGSEVPIEIGLNPIHTPDGTFVLASVVDISERKRLLERELQRASEELAGRFDQTRAAALALFTSEFDEQRILTGTLELLADRHQFPVALYYSADPQCNVLHLTAARGAPENAAREIAVGVGLVGAAAQSGQSIYVDDVEPGSFTINTGFAQLTPSALLYCPVSYRGQMLGVVALGATAQLTENDRSAVERLVAQLGAALHNIKQYANLQLLAEELRERGEEIQLKNNQLEAASRMKSEFLANMSHELRTPLNAIIGFAEILKDGLIGDLSAQQRECVQDIHESGLHLLALINDILDLSKIEAGRLDVELGSENPVALIESGLAIVREKAMTQRVRLLSQWPDDLGLIELDVRKVKQIVFNLLSNAVKFTGEGGDVTVSLERMSRAMVESALAQTPGRIFAPESLAYDEYLRIRVADTGIGITHTDLERLFEPFTQVDSALSRKHTGTGLGLAMVRRLVELLDGAMAVASTVDVGSIFDVWLPWIDSPEPTMPELIGLAPVQKHSPQILVIEDRVQDAQLLRMQLISAGFRVALTPSAEGALQIMERERPDAIVLDIILPGMDGWDLLATLKSHAEFADIPVVIVSVTDDAHRGFVLGAANVLVKPVSQVDLIAALRGVGLLSAAPRKVLVIDDDARTLSLLASQIQAAGLQVLAANSGAQGIELARQTKPDLVVLDLIMPEISGFDVLAALRADEETALIPVLVLTAHSLSSQQRAELQDAALQVVEKSNFKLAELIGEIQRAVKRGY